MIVTILEMLRYCLVLVFGVAVSLLFAGVRIGRLVTAFFCIVVILFQVLTWKMMGIVFTTQVYPLIVHLPLILFLVFYFKRPWLISISSVLAAYLCCQVPRWIGAVMMVIVGDLLANHISYIATMAVVYYFLKRHIASSVQELMERSLSSCLLFGTVPFLYYIFDYVTTVYTDLLYSGAYGAVQFMPSLVCTFYFLFVLLYYNESQKQAHAQRERDLFALQLHQAQLDFDNMRQIEKNTIISRHDMRHHLALIGSFAADGNLSKIKEYVTSTEATIDALTPKRYCENETINLILSAFNTRAKKMDVAMKVDVKLPAILGVNDTELCALLSNALENAITAAAQLEDKKLRKIYIHAIVTNHKLVISTENAYVGKIEMEGELPKSKNKDYGHGFGIKSMITIVERHGGLYSFETEGGVFILQLLLPLGNLI
ncbi:histidine kinase [Sporanaerobium hydrogeniformans]|uniref:Histidine kinase n=1 Tax=Sporanaerobium hydrogeniformans TaxID=3072179 RepID=A0AC61DCK8_9FIRM|nr:ATP-binding protein [Sporanaerobium hydrogeniformans]PHV70513.1 histidine kinase [Sporanaerobium hydrogeniformans]